MKRPKWQWGDESFRTREGMREGIQSYVAGELTNNHLGEVITPGGKSYYLIVRVDIELVDADKHDAMVYRAADAARSRR
jgi:hypothetical protein